MSIYNVVSGKQTGSSVTSHTQIPYQNFEYLKSNTWTKSKTGGKTVDMSRGVFFESNSKHMKAKIDAVQARKAQYQRQITFNSKGSSLVHGGGGTSQPVPHGKPPIMDYYRLKQGLMDTTPKLSDTDKALMLLGVIAVILFLKS